jgi:hypothetical protein
MSCSPILLWAVAKRRTFSPWVIVAVIPLLLQMWVWHALYGHWIHFSYEGEGFDWAHPALLQTLFSSRHGLFFWSPLLVAAVVGVVRQRWTAFGLAWLLLWYANSAWHTWWFGDAFGARAFLDLAPIYILGLASLNLPIAFIVLCGVYNWVMMALYITHRIPRDSAISGSHLRMLSHRSRRQSAAPKIVVRQKIEDWTRWANARRRAQGRR